MNKYLSIKLKAISFFATFMVTYIHSSNVLVRFPSEYLVSEKGYSYFIQEFISQGLTRVAVPLFFAISGYLFFLNIKGEPHEFFLKIKKRAKTLVIPYLFWSLLSLLIFFILQSLPFSEKFFTSKLVRDLSANELLSSVFLNPLSYPLWFIRDLIMLALVSPLIYLAVRYLKYLSILLLLPAWIFGFNFVIFFEEALFFFVCGSFLSIRKVEKLIQTRFTKNPWIYFCLWLLIILAKTILVFTDLNNPILLNILLKLSILTGVFSLWIMYDYLFKATELADFKYFGIFSFSFFLYASHEPLLTIIKKVFFFTLETSEFTSLVIYLTAPLITIAICISIAYRLKKTRPGFYEIITGGR